MSIRNLTTKHCSCWVRGVQGTGPASGLQLQLLLVISCSKQQTAVKTLQLPQLPPAALLLVDHLMTTDQPYLYPACIGHHFTDKHWSICSMMPAMMPPAILKLLMPATLHVNSTLNFAVVQMHFIASQGMWSLLSLLAIPPCYPISTHLSTLLSIYPKPPDMRGAISHPVTLHFTYSPFHL